MTDEARKDLLAKSLPGVEKIMLQAREKVKNLPADPDKRASRLHDLQNDIDRRINAVREKVLRAERALK
jgi:vacuolar-type H+-ATPase subunit E/Vma4